MTLVASYAMGFSTLAASRRRAGFLCGAVNSPVPAFLFYGSNQVIPEHRDWTEDAATRYPVNKKACALPPFFEVTK